MFGGLGNDSIDTGLNLAGRDTIQGNEGNDTVEARDGIDTISGGTGNDVFLYTAASEDGNNATGGGPVEFITDVDWAVDRFDTTPNVTFAANTGAGTGADLNASANNAIAAAVRARRRRRHGGGGAVHLRRAAPIWRSTRPTSGVRRHRRPALDITGVTGAIATSNFI